MPLMIGTIGVSGSTVTVTLSKGTVSPWVASTVSVWGNAQNTTTYSTNGAWCYAYPCDQYGNIQQSLLDTVNVLSISGNQLTVNRTSNIGSNGGVMTAGASGPSGITITGVNQFYNTINLTSTAGIQTGPLKIWGYSPTVFNLPIQTATSGSTTFTLNPVFTFNANGNTKPPRSSAGIYLSPSIVGSTYPTINVEPAFSIQAGMSVYETQVGQRGQYLATGTYVANVYNLNGYGLPTYAPISNRRHPTRYIQISGLNGTAPVLQSSSNIGLTFDGTSLLKNLGSQTYRFFIASDFYEGSLAQWYNVYDKPPLPGSTTNGSGFNGADLGWSLSLQPMGLNYSLWLYADTNWSTGSGLTRSYVLADGGFIHNSAVLQPLSGSSFSLTGSSVAGGSTTTMPFYNGSGQNGALALPFFQDEWPGDGLWVFPVYCGQQGVLVTAAYQQSDYGGTFWVTNWANYIAGTDSLKVQRVEASHINQNSFFERISPSAASGSNNLDYDDGYVYFTGENYITNGVTLVRYPKVSLGGGILPSSVVGNAVTLALTNPKGYPTAGTKGIAAGMQVTWVSGGTTYSTTVTAVSSPSQFTVATPVSGTITTSTSLAFNTTGTTVDGSVTNVPSLQGAETLTSVGWATDGEIQNKPEFAGMATQLVWGGDGLSSNWAEYAYRRSADGGLGAISIWYEAFIGGNVVSVSLGNNTATGSTITGSWSQFVDFWQEQYYSAYNAPYGQVLTGCSSTTGGYNIGVTGPMAVSFGNLIANSSVGQPVVGSNIPAGSIVTSAASFNATGLSASNAATGATVSTIAGSSLTTFGIVIGGTATVGSTVVLLTSNSSTTGTTYTNGLSTQMAIYDGNTIGITIYPYGSFFPTGTTIVAVNPPDSTVAPPNSIYLSNACTSIYGNNTPGATGNLSLSASKAHPGYGVVVTPTSPSSSYVGYFTLISIDLNNNALSSISFNGRLYNPYNGNYIAAAQFQGITINQPVIASFSNGTATTTISNQLYGAAVHTEQYFAGQGVDDFVVTYDTNSAGGFNFANAYYTKMICVSGL